MLNAASLVIKFRIISSSVGGMGGLKLTVDTVTKSRIIIGVLMFHLSYFEIPYFMYFVMQPGLSAYSVSLPCVSSLSYIILLFISFLYRIELNG